MEAGYLLTEGPHYLKRNCCYTYPSIRPQTRCHYLSFSFKKKIIRDKEVKINKKNIALGKLPFISHSKLAIAKGEK